MGRFTAGDPLRALAALGILGLHVMVTSPSSMPGDAHTQQTLINAANNALYLFFALSGYLITRPFIRAFVLNHERPRTDDYLRNRILRIVPAFWTVAAVVLLLEALGVSFAYGSAAGIESRTSSVVDAVSVFAFAQNFSDGSAVLLGPLGPAWSLHVELVFYLLVPVAAVLVSRAFGDRGGLRARTAFVLGACAVLFSASVALRSGVEPGDTQTIRHFHNNFWAFVPGVALAALEPAATRGARTRFARPAGAATGLCGLLLVTILTRVLVDVPPAVGTSLTIAAGWGLVLGVLLTREWAGLDCPRALDNRVLRWVGARSYGIFLINWLLLVAVFQLRLIGLGLGFFETLVVVVLLSAVVADLLHRWVELPFLRLKRRPARAACAATAT